MSDMNSIAKKIIKPISASSRMVNSAKKTYRKMAQNLWRGAGYNIIAIPLAAGILYPFGILFNPAIGAILMSLSMIIVAFNARLLS
jgi:Cu2+-exporting ATPase